MRLPFFAVSIFLTVSTVLSQDFSSPQYQQQNRQQKLDMLWNAIIENTSPSSFPKGNQRACIFFENVKVSFSFISDILPPGRRKEIHGVGSVARARFSPIGETRYTGFFKGADSLLIRFSLTTEPNITNGRPQDAQGNFLPGFALKYLINGQPSANLFAMLNLGKINSWNFFSTDISNHVAPPPLGTKKKFSTASIYLQTIGLLKLAEHDQNGNQENPQFPFKLIFRSPPELKTRFPDQFQLSFIDQIATLTEGSTVYQVFAQDTPSSNEVLIGTLDLTSRPTTSKFGDEVLFFQHHDMEFDINVRPEWENNVPKFSFCTFRNLEDFDGPCPFSSP